MSRDASASPETTSKTRVPRRVSRFFGDTRKRPVSAYVVLALLLPVGLVQSWCAHQRRTIAYELPEIEKRITALQAEIEQLHIESESLQSPKRVDELARARGFMPALKPPIVLPAASDSPAGTRPPATPIARGQTALVPTPAPRPQEQVSAPTPAEVAAAQAQSGATEMREAATTPDGSSAGVQ
jgi:cell division protein FtsL